MGTEEYQAKLLRLNEEALNLVGTTLVSDPEVLSRQIDPGSDFARALATLQAAGGIVRRGTDFLKYDYELSQDEMEWLRAHPEVDVFPRKMSSYSKDGRLATVVAHHPRRDEIAEAIKAGGYKPGFSNVEHIARLLTHANAPDCDAFALAVIAHPQMMSNIPASVDGTDAFQFWTYGPAILAELGGNYESFMQDWVMKREILSVGGPGRHARYPGIEYMYTTVRNDQGVFIPRPNALTKDGGDVSHRFAKVIAQKAILPAISRTAR